MAASVGTNVDCEKDGKELNSADLGTKEHWDTTYKRELKNFQDTGDVGEIWFGYDSVERVVEWMEESLLVNMDSTILDLGCGNGVSLIELSKAGFTNLTGVDYSQAAVDLAIAVTKEEEVDINYECCDILAELPKFGSCLAMHFDVCLDKGTYDAISLSPDSPQLQRTKYIENVAHLLKEHGLLIITSCNWTEEELLKHFENSFKFVGKIPTPSFTFGGKKGNRETVLMFKNNSKKSE